MLVAQRADLTAHVHRIPAPIECPEMFVHQPGGTENTHPAATPNPAHATRTHANSHTHAYNIINSTIISRLPGFAAQIANGARASGASV